MHNIFASEMTDTQLHCGTALSGVDSGCCKNKDCGRRSPSLLGGYCTRCAVAKGVNPLKACGCKPIVLTDAAAVATS